MKNKIKLINEIRDAFKNVELDDGVGLREALSLDDCVDVRTIIDIRKNDEKKDWKKISYSEIANCENSLLFFDAKAMRFHLPIYLIFYLLEDEIYPIEGLCAPDIVHTLTHNLEEGYQNEKFSLLNDQQILSVIHFLEFRLLNLKNESHSDLERDNLDYEYATIKNALRYWNKKLISNKL